MIPKNNINYNKAQLFLLCGLLLTGGLPFRSEVNPYKQYEEGASMDDPKLRKCTCSFFDNPHIPADLTELGRDPNRSRAMPHSIGTWGPALTFHRKQESKNSTYLPTEPARKHLKAIIGPAVDKVSDDVFEDSLSLIMGNRYFDDDENTNNQEMLNKFFNDALSSWYGKENSELTLFTNHSVLTDHINSFNSTVRENNSDFVLKYDFNGSDRYLVNQLSLDFFEALKDSKQKREMGASVDKIILYIGRLLAESAGSGGSGGSGLSVGLAEVLESPQEGSTFGGSSPEVDLRNFKNVMRSIPGLDHDSFGDDKKTYLASFIIKYNDFFNKGTTTKSKSFYGNIGNDAEYTVPKETLDNDILSSNNSGTLRKFAIIKDMFTPERMKTWLTTDDNQKLDM